MIELYKAAGRWQENDAYVPSVGDVVFYDWQDTGKGDNTGYPDHVGLVCGVSGSTIKVIEGNKNDAVEYRDLPINGRYIRGYGLPDYASMATAAEPEKPATPAKKSVAEVAREVLAGKWGNGSDRKRRLEVAGYNYAEVQAAVNALAKGAAAPAKKSVAEVAKEVLSGKWGNGAERKKKLTAAGYNYAEVQAAVNKLCR